MELKFNNLLLGVPGSILVRIDVSGFRRAELVEHEPRAGMDLVLTIDSRIQRLAEQSLGDEAGAVVVLDTANGDVLAMASAPAFDPNIFVPFLPAEAWNELVTDPNHPLINRVTGAIYPPGSVFKPIVALAALEHGSVTDHAVFNCPGYFELGAVRFGCWHRAGHGTISMNRAIEQSCNSYFCAIGLKTGLTQIRRRAEEAGYGRRTGIDCDYEMAGILPDNAWKRRVMKDDWRPGDTCNLSIGQGALSVTPLQVAVMTAALANGGRVFKPRIVLGARDQGGTILHPMPADPPRQAPWSTASLRIIRRGMFGVVQATDGTGMRARIPGVNMAGKTGTAEYGPRDQRKKHAWMIVFAPYEAPRYAAAMVLDAGESGGRSVAPRMHELMDGIFNGSTGQPEDDGGEADG